MKEATLTLGTTNDNVVTTGGDFFIVSGPTANFTISGFAGGSSGRKIQIWNQTKYRMTIERDSASSLAANRIYTGSGSNLQTGASTDSPGGATLVYSSTLSRWVVTSWMV